MENDLNINTRYQRPQICLRPRLPSQILQIHGQHILPNHPNSSISCPKIKYDLDSSISQQIIKYTEELKVYLLSKLEGSSQSTTSQNKCSKDKVRTQSYKNLKHIVNFEANTKKANKSVKNIKHGSQPSIHQFAVKNSLGDLYKQDNLDHLRKMTSWSKLINEQSGDIKDVSSCWPLQLKSLEKRMVKLQILVKALSLENKLKQIRKRSSQFQKTQNDSKKCTIRSKNWFVKSKKKVLSLQNPQQILDESKMRKENKENSTKKLYEPNKEKKMGRNMQQHQRSLFPTKKSNLRLNGQYQRVIKFTQKPLKKVIFKNSIGFQPGQE